MKLYHGTFSEIESFWPCSHFGEKMQAILAVGLHRFAAKKQQIFQSGEPRLYECEINIKEHEILDVADWGAPNPQANLLAFANGVKRKKEIFTDLYLDIEDNAYDSQWLEKLQHEAGEKGILAMRYTNVVENIMNNKSPSLMVIDPNRITDVKCRKLSWGEILRVLDQYDSTNYHGDWNKIMADARHQANIAP